MLKQDQNPIITKTDLSRTEHHTILDEQGLGASGFFLSGNGMED